MPRRRVSDRSDGDGDYVDLFTSREWVILQDRLCLSMRESQILQGVISDCKESTIASQLDISPHTVRTHVERLYRKLYVTSRSALLVRVFSEYLKYLRSGGHCAVPTNSDDGNTSVQPLSVQTRTHHAMTGKLNNTR